MIISVDQARQTQETNFVLKQQFVPTMYDDDCVASQC